MHSEGKENNALASVYIVQSVFHRCLEESYRTSGNYICNAYEKLNSLIYISNGRALSVFSIKLTGAFGYNYNAGLALLTCGEVYKIVLVTNSLKFLCNISLRL